MSARIEVKIEELIGCLKDLTTKTNDVTLSIVIDDARTISIIAKDKDFRSNLLEYSIWASTINETPSLKSTSKLFFRYNEKLELD